MRQDSEVRKLDGLVESKTPVRIYLRNGICLRGIIVEHDPRVLVCCSITKGSDANTTQLGDENIVYKDAISTIVVAAKREQHGS